MAKAESACRPRYPYATPRIAWPSAVVVCPGSAGWSTGGAQLVPEPRRDRRLNEVSESCWGTAPPALADSRRPFGGAGPGPRRGAHTRRIPPRRRGGRNWPMGHSGCGWRRAWSRFTGRPGCGSGCRGTSRRRCGKPSGGWAGRAARRRCRRGTAPNASPIRRPTGY